MFAPGLGELFGNISVGAKFRFVNIQHLGVSRANHVMQVDNGPSEEGVEAVPVMMESSSPCRGALLDW